MNDATAVFADGNYSMAIVTDGSLLAWGDNSYGQLGNGTIMDSHYPIKVMYDVAAVSLTGGRAMAITTNNDIYSWGKYLIGYYFSWGIHFGRQLIPELVFDTSGFVPRSIYLLGRWRLRSSSESEVSLDSNFFTIYAFLPDGTGMVNERYLTGNTSLPINDTPFTWELFQNGELLITFDNGTYMLAPISIQRFQNSSGRIDILTMKNEELHKEFGRRPPGLLFEGITID